MEPPVSTPFRSVEIGTPKTLFRSNREVGALDRSHVERMCYGDLKRKAQFHRVIAALVKFNESKVALDERFGDLKKHTIRSVDCA